MNIKFRGKSKISGKWVFGYYVKRWCCHFIEFNIGDDNWERIDIDKNTVGIYIGLNDKNQKELYTGDIVLWAGMADIKFVISFFKGAYYACYKNEQIQISNGDYCKKVGNIFDDEIS